MYLPVFICFVVLIQQQLEGIYGSSSDLLEVTSQRQTTDVNYRPEWSGSRRWTGPDWWANPIYDWSQKKGWIVGAASAGRTLALLPFEIGNSGASFTAAVTVQFSINRRIADAESGSIPATVGAGFSIGRSGKMSDFRSAAVYASQSIQAIVNRDGYLTIGSAISTDKHDITAGPIRLKLSVERMASLAKLTFCGVQKSVNITVQTTVPASHVVGGVALSSEGPGKDAGAPTGLSFRFARFRLSGPSVLRFPGRAFGPIMWTQYSLSEGVLRLQAQLAPVNMRLAVHLGIGRGTEWTRISTVKIAPLSRTATFEVPAWDSTSSQQYEVRIRWAGTMHFWHGRIRREPRRTERLRIGVFSCDKGYTFPDNVLVSQVQRQEPDMLFFAGDQMYEFVTAGFSVARTGKLSVTVLDFLRKYYLFGWLWRPLLSNTPSIILPDDHDVFQGNLWGHGGRQLPNTIGKIDTSLGGYVMPGAWVKAVERCHVGHLPPPAENMTLPIGIKPYFTSLKYGDVSFAVLEDRKFKIGPRSGPPELYNDGGDGDLLGKEQERFVARWTQDWSDVSMKVALSQTIFCRAATHIGEGLKKIAYIQDSGAWPKKASRRVVRMLGDAHVLTMHGDQHLGVLLQHGIDNFNDAGYSFMVPGTANGFPRAWWPGVSGHPATNRNNFTGHFHDAAGNPLDVIAVANPSPGSSRLETDISQPMKVAYAKGSGYGMVDMDRVAKSAEVHLYRVGGRSNEQFAGFPKTIYVGGNPSS